MNKWLVAQDVKQGKAIKSKKINIKTSKNNAK
jgi:hypothetical protein